MLLTHLSLTNFRSYARLDTDIPGRILLLSGGNAQGKTSLLEALFYCASFSSPLAQSDRQLIHFDVLHDPVAVARIVIHYERETQKHQMEVRIIQENDALSEHNPRVRKEVLIDGVKTTAQKAIGSFTAVLFLPQMTRILEGPPDERRRYLNIMLSQSVPGYARALSECKQIVTRRNALLKLLSERSSDPQQLDYWDQMLAERAAVLIINRQLAINWLEEHAAEIHQQLTEGKEQLKLSYRPAFDPSADQTDWQRRYAIAEESDPDSYDAETLIAKYRDCLKSCRARDIERGVTVIGPHRDDFSILGNGLDLCTYGSRGQIRTALLSLKLAEIAWMKERCGTSPLLLLDETLAELDEQRSRDLLVWLDQCEQGILTTTDLAHFPADFISRQTVWQVQNGKILLQ